MSSSTAENIVFMVIRGVVSLAIVGVSVYCISQGIHFFILPHAEAEAIQVEVLGLHISASGLGAVIFGTGIALCFVALRTAPRRIESKRTTENPPLRITEDSMVMMTPFRTSEETRIASAIDNDSPFNGPVL
jgi:hypothetical protein